LFILCPWLISTASCTDPSTVSGDNRFAHLRPAGQRSRGSATGRTRTVGGRTCAPRQRSSGFPAGRPRATDSVRRSVSELARPVWTVSATWPTSARRTGRAPMTPAPSAVASRNRNRARLRAVTAAAGIASVLTAAGVTYTLPGPAHATAAHASSGSSKSGSQASAGASSGSSGTGSSGSGSSSSGLRTSAPPSAASGSGQVTSGGS
jgi:hypothetical protein